ncbi:dysbindin-like [Apostichopus japonicus]|uniref:dysbindin-like n=1 Tax=Stichopus japonicus TaxID=307972 RepID=UPI003AB3C4A5
MFEQFKEKFQAVQQDLSDGIKSLSVKAQKASKTNRNSENLSSKHDNLPNLREGLHISAGADLLDHFQGTWTNIHEAIEDCANRATDADALIQQIAFNQEKKFAEWRDIKKHLQEIPNLLEDIQSITAKIGKLTADFEEVEASLVELEDVIDEEEYRQNEEIQRKELENYQKQKLHEEGLLRARLQDEFDEKLNKKQKEEDAKKRERQQAFQDFFADDLKHYKEFGQMQRPMEVAAPETHLEDFELEWDEHDQQALNDFLGPPEDQRSSEVNLGSSLGNKESSEKNEFVERNDDEEGEKADVVANKKDEELLLREDAPSNNMEQQRDNAQGDRKDEPIEDAPISKMEEEVHDAELSQEGTKSRLIDHRENMSSEEKNDGDADSDEFEDAVEE